jgi:murein DD-endopeptidase MepM/ murein hydrolase activator NlpD
MPVSNFEEGMLFSGDELWLSATLGDFRTHKGMDFITGQQEEVYACHDGIVTQCYKKFGEGNVVVIKHNDDLFTVYKSLSDDVKVRAGDTVKKGDHIGYTSDSMGNEFAEGIHLHLEVIYQDELINPMEYLETGNK